MVLITLTQPLIVGGTTFDMEGPDGAPIQREVTKEDMLSRMDGINYLAITTRDMIPHLESLLEWKDLKGVSSSAVAVEDIYAAFSAPDNASSIHAFLRNASAREPMFKYLLLAGDTELVPTRHIYTYLSQYDSNAKNTAASDVYYSGLETTWDENGDGKYGEWDGEVDFTPELYVGRFPASDGNQLDLMVQRTLTYEVSPGNGWTGSMLLVDGLFGYPNEGPDNPHTPLDEGYGWWEDNGYEVSLALEKIIPQDMDIRRLNDFPHIEGGAPDSYVIGEDTLDQSGFRNALGQNPGLVNAVTHAGIRYGEQLMAYATDGVNQGWSRVLNCTQDIPVLNNDKPFFMYVSSCSILDFSREEDNDFETMLYEGNAGAVGLVGASGWTYRGELYDTQNDQEYSLGNWWINQRFWNNVFNGQMRSMGQALYETKRDYHSYMESTPHGLGAIDYFNFLRGNIVSYNLMGDPETPLWTAEPVPVAVEIPQIFSHFTAVPVNVTVPEGFQGLVKVTVHTDNGCHTQFGEGGIISVPVPSGSLSNLSQVEVVVEGTNVLPVHYSVPIQNAPDLTVDPDAFQIDGHLLTGMVHNVGKGDAGNVEVSASWTNDTGSGELPGAFLGEVKSGADYPFTLNISRLPPGSDLEVSVSSGLPRFDINTSNNQATFHYAYNLPPRVDTSSLGFAQDPDDPASYILDLGSLVDDPDSEGFTFRLEPSDYGDVLVILKGDDLHIQGISSDWTGHANIRLSVSDGYNTVGFWVNITHSTLVGEGKPNHPPVLPDWEDQTAVVGKEFRFLLNAHDPDGDVVHYSLDVAWASVDSATGELVFTPVDDQVGMRIITVTASDGKNDTSQEMAVWVDAQGVVSRDDTDDSALSTAVILSAVIAVLVFVLIMQFLNRKRSAEGDETEKDPGSGPGERIGKGKGKSAGKGSEKGKGKSAGKGSGKGKGKSAGNGTDKKPPRPGGRRL